MILDEPFNGLDEGSVENFINIIMEFKNKGTTILLASHIREDIERLCDEVYKIDAGILRGI